MLHHVYTILFFFFQPSTLLDTTRQTCHRVWDLQSSPPKKKEREEKKPLHQGLWAGHHRRWQDLRQVQGWTRQNLGVLQRRQPVCHLLWPGLAPNKQSCPVFEWWGSRHKPGPCSGVCSLTTSSYPTLTPPDHNISYWFRQIWTWWTTPTPSRSCIQPPTPNELVCQPSLIRDNRSRSITLYATSTHDAFLISPNRILSSTTNASNKITIHPPTQPSTDFSTQPSTDMSTQPSTDISTQPCTDMPIHPPR